LIDENVEKININYVFNNSVPALAALNANMITLFNKIISNPSFDNKITDGFGETILQAILYVYSSDTVTSTSEDEKKLVAIINSIIDSNIFDYNECDFTRDTALTIACAYPKMNWATKKLISNKKVDVNHTNIFNQSPVSICIMKDNLEILEELGKRPDLVITEEDKKVAKNHNVKLDKFIHPDSSVLVDVDSMESLLSELESAASVATR
jgi:ankyrin repeat protein